VQARNQPLTEILERLLEVPIMKILRAGSAIAAILFLAFTLSCGESATTEQQLGDIASQQDTIDGYGEPLTTEQRLAELARLVEDIESYRVTMTMEMEMMGRPLNAEQEITFKRPDKMRITGTMNMADAERQEIYSSGDVMWIYYPKWKRATKIDMSKYKDTGQNPSGMAESPNIMNIFQNIPEDMIEYVEDEVTDEGLAHVFKAAMDIDLQEEMPPNTPLPKETVYWISVDSGLPVRVIGIDENGSTIMEQTYSDFQINPEIDDSIFEFTPPEGVQVNDMTNYMTSGKQTMQGRRGRRRQRR
jgi:outer membrane lipoprotein-sorting protein